MKVLLISASPRRAKSQTLALAQQVVQGLGPSARAEIVHLRDLKIDCCTHCEACHVASMRCPIKDDVTPLLEKMLAADGIILATPNYINQVTGSLKVLLDRSSHFIHCKRLLGKYLCGVVSSGSGTQDGLVLDYIRYYGRVCGAQYSGGVSACAYRLEAAFPEALNLGRKFARDIGTRRRYPAQLRLIEKGKAHFRTIMEMRKGHWKEEYAYWQTQGWL
ncbi:MAG: hypothetical protein A2X36_17495 [Elusimicrobia bacterium GWA2_69_24]|nr:MAG: hypothetical protein A2X36_17495 [Elusimicrobia bacterium GWA2_69_24]HBL18780.1 iron-sulfur protein [Elusimicrobiota bacterium]